MWRSLLRTIRHSGDHSLASWVRTRLRLACRCLSSETENQPRTGCQWESWDCLAVTYCPRLESSWVRVVTRLTSGAGSSLSRPDTRWTRLAVRQRA